MGWPIDLNDESNRQAHEIDDRVAERKLPAESEVANTLFPQLVPKQLFGLGRILPQQFDPCVDHFRLKSTCSNPLPLPPSHEGRGDSRVNGGSIAISEVKVVFEMYSLALMALPAKAAPIILA